MKIKFDTYDERNNWITSVADTLESRVTNRIPEIRRYSSTIHRYAYQLLDDLLPAAPEQPFGTTYDSLEYDFDNQTWVVDGSELADLANQRGSSDAKD